MATAERTNQSSRVVDRDALAIGILVTGNFLVAALWAILMVISLKGDTPLHLLLFVGPVFAFCVMAVANVGSVFMLWKRQRFRSLIPLGTFVIAAVLSEIGVQCGMDIALRGTLYRPESFLCGQTREELTSAAKQLLGDGFKVVTADDPAEVRMIAGRQRSELPPGIIEILRKYDFRFAQVDDRQEIVTFGHYRKRVWFEYIWAKNGLLEPSLMPSGITEVDIEDWGELVRIAKQGRTSTPEDRRRISFEPALVYPVIQTALGSEALTRIASAASENAITDAERAAILSALNRERLTSSALVEHPEVTYEPRWFDIMDSGLCVGRTRPSDEFWVVSLLKQLLSDGVLARAPDGRHLRIKRGVTERQQLQVEWLHIGIMNFIYGNLMEKRQHPFEQELGDNWYFHRW